MRSSAGSLCPIGDGLCITVLTISRIIGDDDQSSLCMEIFSIQNAKLLPVREKAVDLEKTVQTLTEANLEAVFELQLLRSEFRIKNFRIDSLAFDKETNAFVVIEYKRGGSFSVIDQGYAYLALMLNNKADFVLEYNDRTKQSLRKEDIDWSQSRVLFIANSFNTYQQNAIHFRDLPIELWEVRFFENSTVLYSRLASPEASESIKTISKSKTIEAVSKEVRVYTLDDHLNAAGDKIKSVFLQLRERILALGDGIEERPKKFYIAYRRQSGFAYVELQKAKMKIHITVSRKELDDPRSITRDVTNIGHFGVGDTEISFDEGGDLNYVMSLIEQSYRAAGR